MKASRVGVVGRWATTKRGARHHKAPVLVVGIQRSSPLDDAVGGRGPWQEQRCVECGASVWVDAVDLAPYHNRAVVVLCERCALLRGSETGSG